MRWSCLLIATQALVLVRVFTLVDGLTLRAPVKASFRASRRLLASAQPQEDMKTLSSFLEDEVASGRCTEELASVLGVLEASCRQVSSLLSRGELDRERGQQGNRLAGGDGDGCDDSSSPLPDSLPSPTSLASAAGDVFHSSFAQQSSPSPEGQGGGCSGIASVLALRTRKFPVPLVSDKAPSSPSRSYAVVVDPLGDDGGGRGSDCRDSAAGAAVAASIDAFISTGTVFGVFPVHEEEEEEELGKDKGGGSGSDCAQQASRSQGLSTAQVSSSTQQALLRRGSELAAAGCCMYSSSTMLMISIGQQTQRTQQTPAAPATATETPPAAAVTTVAAKTRCATTTAACRGQVEGEVEERRKSEEGRVDCFTLDPNRGQFVLTHPNVRIPLRGKTYSVDEGLESLWPEKFASFITDAKNGASASKTPYSARFVGSIVPDVHRTLLYGGIFAAPELTTSSASSSTSSPSTSPTTSSSSSSVIATVPLLFTAAPLAFLAEQAGGAACKGLTPSKMGDSAGDEEDRPSGNGGGGGFGGRERVLSALPASLHATTGLYLGSAEDILEATT